MGNRVSERFGRRQVRSYAGADTRKKSIYNTPSIRIYMALSKSFRVAECHRYYGA